MRSISVDLSSQNILGRVFPRSVSTLDDIGFVIQKESTEKEVEVVEKEVKSAQEVFAEAVVESSVSGSTPKEYKKYFVY